MTVIIGALCKDGLVVAADREISGDNGVKFYEKKLFTFSTKNTDVVLGYSGLPDVMRGLAEDLKGRLDGNDKSSADIENDLREALATAIAKNERTLFLTLCGFRGETGYRLLKTYQRQIFPVPMWDCIGIADNTSVLRYLGAIFLEESLPVYRTVPICNYMVTQAKKYVLGCGGQTDLSVIGLNGKTTEQFSSAFSDHLCDMVERSFNAILTAATEPDVSIERITSLLEALRNVLNSSIKAFPALTL